ncbi:bifunctional 2-polyprenyl-6-hydroxyphenol methylase/3-demethylubiquinol 3-O-methyltransferase UbiG [Modestobacter sp. Leaf380]|uniref:class I SAM-dependent methyltransferase n=1 Tax=Modestobacter sp. Leaf380 TaxID=1736356 RepID=UPI000700E3DD|nr:methyltransferase domain-containing protein [Modestobacter sp. Leaf380]KQS68367.1 hypothetical protein ASG41_05050 [Modestobacter sp. Leaf380]
MTGDRDDPAGRDLEDYVRRYETMPFEPRQAAFRRRRVLQQVAARSPRRVLEIGCGLAPLFTDLPGTHCVVVEPSPVFVEAARRLVGGREDVLVVQDFGERVTPDAVGGVFDVVVLSCLLHEVPDPGALLRAARALCGSAGVLHVNVPNARSLHRLLAVAMRLIPDVTAQSVTQRDMQQDRIYDAEALTRTVQGAGFDVIDAGSIFVKPFTHAQMQRLLDDGFLTPALLDGLDALALSSPELGSELWVDAVPSPA